MYQIKVNGDYTFSINKYELDSLDAVKTSTDQFHILHQNTSLKAQIQEGDFNNKSYTIKVNNNVYEVNINDELDQLIAEMGFEVGAHKQVNEIKAPMPGLILEINVTEGQEVKEDDPLLILEAMKMENVITSPRSGIIKSIKVKQSDAVDKNTLLLDFE